MQYEMYVLQMIYIHIYIYVYISRERGREYKTCKMYYLRSLRNPLQRPISKQDIRFIGLRIDGTEFGVFGEVGPYVYPLRDYIGYLIPPFPAKQL